MAADFGIGTAANVAAANVAGPIISLVIGKMKDVIEMGKNVSHLKTDFTRMQGDLEDIENQFRHQQRALPLRVQNCLERIRDELQKVKDLIDDSEAQPGCLGCYCSLRNPKLPTQIRDWKTGFDRLFQELKEEILLCANTIQIVDAAPLQVDALRQPVPESGFVGSAIEDAQKKVHAWLSEADRQARMVGIWGMGGVGKTSILKLIYNHFKEVRGTFDAVIWLTISRKYEITNLQASIAETLNLNLERSSDKDIRKMQLSESLGKKKFLLILDDLWRSIDLTEVGVTFGNHNCSKVLMSSRSKLVIGQMGASHDYSLKIQPLSTEEGLVLFRREAFTNGVVPYESVQGIAREIAMECQGLPLALNVVAAAMRLKETKAEWERALNLMRTVDPSFRISNSEEIANLSNLMELVAAVKSEIKESTMTTWTELRRLEVSCVYDADRDDVGEEHIFPFNMDNLNKLEHFTLKHYKGVSLPNCIPQLQNLRLLCLYDCEQLRELPGMVGGWGFPMLKRLSLGGLSKLESMMVGSSVSGLSSEETMPQLEDIDIKGCSSLKRLRTRKLPRLKKLGIFNCTEFEALEIESCGLPMLEDLTLFWLGKCETIVGPSGVINDGVMPKLQHLKIDACPSLRRLVLEKLSNLRDIVIEDCWELRELAVGNGGFPALETLRLYRCSKVENMVGPYDVWDENTMPQLRSLYILSCPLVRRLPRGMEKLSRLLQIYGEVEWWQNLIWEDENVKNILFSLFRHSLE